MKKKIYNWLFKKAQKVIALNIIRYGNVLTPEYLINKGWIEDNGFYYENGIKDKYRLSIRFESYYYKVYYTEKNIPIGTGASTIEWFETFYLLIHHDNGLYELANI